MTCTKEQLLERIQGSKVRRNGRREFEAELQRDVREYALGRVAEGQSRNQVASELGIDGWTVTRWLQAEEQTNADIAFVEVSKSKATTPRAVMATSAPTFELTCPNGFSIQVPTGFQENELRRLLRVVGN